MDAVIGVKRGVPGATLPEAQAAPGAPARRRSRQGGRGQPRQTAPTSPWTTQSNTNEAEEQNQIAQRPSKWRFSGGCSRISRRPISLWTRQRRWQRISRNFARPGERSGAHARSKRCMRQDLRRCVGLELARLVRTVRTCKREVKRFAETNAREVTFHCFLQWIADRSLPPRARHNKPGCGLA